MRIIFCYFAHTNALQLLLRTLWMITWATYALWVVCVLRLGTLSRPMKRLWAVLIHLGISSKLFNCVRMAVFACVCMDLSLGSPLGLTRDFSRILQLQNGILRPSSRILVLFYFWILANVRLRYAHFNNFAVLNIMFMVAVCQECRNFPVTALLGIV